MRCARGPPKFAQSRLFADGGIGNIFVVCLGLHGRAFHLVNIETGLLQSLSESEGFPRLGIHLRIVDGNCNFQVIEVGAAVSLDDVQEIAVRPAGIVQPGSVVKSIGLSNKSIIVRPSAH